MYRPFAARVEPGRALPRLRIPVAAVLCAVLAMGPSRVSRAGEDASEEAERAVATRMMQELMSGRRDIGAPFSLPDHSGKARSISEFRGKLVLLYFGYTFCPDVCPTDLLSVSRAMELLGPKAAQVQPIFVTLDPERDTGAVIGPYAAAFNPRFVALRGTEAEVRRIATSFRVYYRKVRPPGSASYLIDHTAYTFLLDREGRYVAFFPPATSGERIAAFLKDQLQ